MKKSCRRMDNVSKSIIIGWIDNINYKVTSEKVPIYKAEIF